MINPQFKKQVALLLRVLTHVAKEKNLALHGGSAINLFFHEMPRLSVDIDLTYLNINSREDDLNQINSALSRLKVQLQHTISGIKVKGPGMESEEFKLFCSVGRTMVKIEVNTINRGIDGLVQLLPLCETAQKEFNMFCEMQIVPLGQLYGGKIVASLDRQHPRDLFDIRAMLNNYGYSDNIHLGFIFCLLSSKRPFHELLQPARIDQHKVLESQFSGMTDEVFTYELFEETREILIQQVNNHLSASDKSLLMSFATGEPEWPDVDYSVFPGIRWKLMNIRRFEELNKIKFKQQIKLLEKVLF